METQIFHHGEIYLQKSSKRNQNPARYYDSITNLQFQHKPNSIIFQKSAYKNRPITNGPKSLKLLYFIIKLLHNILALVGVIICSASIQEIRIIKRLGLQPLTSNLQSLLQTI
jgi:hypothetical protein